MEELLISLLIVVIILAALWYIAKLLPDPAQRIARVVIMVGAVLWLILHVRQIVTAIAHCC
jgi:hypothetical protein